VVEQQRGEWTYNWVIFWVNVDLGIRKGVQKIYEPRNCFSSTDTGLRHLLPGKLRNEALPAGDTIQRVIVECHDNPVRREVDVGFQIAVPE